MLVPLLGAAFGVYAQYSGLDLFLENLYFDPASGTWPFQKHFLTADLLHAGGRKFVLLLAVLNLLAIGASFFVELLKPYRTHLLFLMVAGLTGPAIVAGLKSITHIYSPWDLQIYGGTMPHVLLFDAIPAGAPVGHGFPGGHSSSGFAYLSLFFLLTTMRHKYRWYGLLFPLGLGMVFSATQEIRGAHFLSHDVFSFVICWVASFGWSLLFYPDYYRGDLVKAIDSSSGSSIGSGRGN